MFDQGPPSQEHEGRSRSEIDLDPFLSPRDHGGDSPPDDWGGTGDGSLAGPGLTGTGRGLELSELVLGGIEDDLGNLGGDDKATAHQKLDQIAAKKLAEIEAHELLHDPANQNEQTDQTEQNEQNDQTGPTKTEPAKTEPVKTAPRTSPKQAPQAVPMAADRDGMRAQIVTAGETELAQLDAALARQVADLDRRFDGQLGSLDQEIAKQTDGIDRTTQTGDQQLVKDIGARSEAHQTQIKKEAGTHATEVATQQKPLAAQADQDRAAAKHQAEQEAAATRAHAHKRAEDTRAGGKREAAAARRSGTDKAAQAIAAADGRAGQLSGDEATSVKVDGKRRADQARSEGERQAVAIEAKAEAAAKKLIADGERAAQAQLDRGTKAVAGVGGEQTKQNQRVQTQADVASAEMQMHAANAHGRMEAERAAFHQQAAGAKNGAAGGMDAQRQAAQAKAAELKAEAIEKLRQTHARDRAKVEAKTQKMLEDLDRAKDKDLGRVGKQLGRELYALDQSDKQADQAMKSQVQRAERKVKAEVACRKRKVKAEAAKARLAIEAFVRDARKRIARADKGTDKDIAGAAKRGLDAIKNVGADALTALTDANAAVRTDQAKQAADDRKALDATADKVGGEMAKLATGVSATVDKQWLDDAMAEANTKLDDSGIFNVVTDGEATRAMNVLTGLPPHLQGQAVEKLGKDQFENLLDEVPFGRREELETLVKNTSDPDRKLALWGEFHKSKAMNDVERAKGDTGEDKWFWQRTAEEEEAGRRHDARKHAAKHTSDEVDEELEFLRDQKKAGKAFTAADVDKLMERKSTEHAMEMKYNVNLTNEEGARKDGSKIVWTKPELDALEASFGQIPESHMAGNKMLKEMRREDVHETPTVGGTHSGGVVTVFDSGARLAGNNFRHGGDQRELASPYICGRCGTKITILDMVVTHEIGHDIHDQNDDEFKKFQQISGWENKNKSGLKKAGLSDAEIQQLEDTRKKNYSQRNTITKDGKLYMVDPYGSGYLVVDDTALPARGEAETGAGGTDGDTWGYARSNYKDHFAETYAKAVHVPEKLHKDLVERPAAATQQAQGQVAAQQQMLAALQAAGADAAAIEAQQKLVEQANADLARAQKAESQRKQQFDLMRNDVFHTDTAQTDAVSRLQAKGITPEKLREFQERAAKASTPEQIKTLEAEY